MSFPLFSFAIRNNKRSGIMKEDRDLLFLQQAKNEDLKVLVDILTHDTDGEVRISERLTNTDAYLYCYPNCLNRMWKEIAGESQLTSGNS